MKRLLTMMALPIAALTLAGCQQQDDEPASETQATDQELTLPVSTNAMMVGLIDNFRRLYMGARQRPHAA